MHLVAVARDLYRSFQRLAQKNLTSGVQPSFPKALLTHTSGPLASTAFWRILSPCQSITVSNRAAAALTKSRGMLLAGDDPSIVRLCLLQRQVLRLHIIARIEVDPSTPVELGVGEAKQPAVIPLVDSAHRARKAVEATTRWPVAERFPPNFVLPPMLFSSCAQPLGKYIYWRTRESRDRTSNLWLCELPVFSVPIWKSHSVNEPSRRHSAEPIRVTV